jgi:hypothetical protein
MRVRFAFFADAARINQQGTCDIIGAGADGVRAKTLPAVLANLAMIARIEFETTEIGHEYEVVLDCIQPDGSQRPRPISNKMVAGPHPWLPGHPNYALLVIEMPISEFSNYGSYNFRLKCADTVLYELAFGVVPMEKQ